MRFSKYNIIKTDLSIVWIYNTLTGAFVKLKKHLYDHIWEEDKDNIRISLLKQGILTVDKDEILNYKYKYYKSAFSNEVLHLCIAPTMKCNFTCFYCFEGENKTMKTMNREVEDALINYIELNKTRKISINWFGGEPLLGFERILSIVEKLERKKILFESTLVTNGSLLTKSKIQALDKLRLTHIQISLDGLSETHDKRRFFKNGLPSFDIIRNGIELFLKYTTLPLYIQVAVDKTNDMAYHDVLQYFEQKYPQLINKRIQVGCNFVKDRTSFDEKSFCFNCDEIFAKQIDNFKSGKRNQLSPYLPGISYPCMYRCSQFFAIDPSGNMYKCLEHLGNPEYKIGNLLKGTVSQKAMSLSTFAEDPFEDPECVDCAVFPICSGGCPTDRIVCKKNNSHDHCSIHKTNLANLLPYIYELKSKKSSV